MRENTFSYIERRTRLTLTVRRQWLPRNKLQLLGVNGEIDRVKLSEGRRPGIRRNVEAAYRRALRHRGKVNGEIPDSDDENKPSRSCFNSDSKL